MSLVRIPSARSRRVRAGLLACVLAAAAAPALAASGYVVARSQTDWRKAGRIVPDLSRACAARDFREAVPLRFRAFLKGEVLGVAFGAGDNLHDPRRLARREAVYLFRNGDSTACVVLETDRSAFAKLSSGS